jgi:hypothetical protein
VASKAFKKYKNELLYKPPKVKMLGQLNKKLFSSCGFVLFLSCSSSTSDTQSTYEHRRVPQDMGIQSFIPDLESGDLNLPIPCNASTQECDPTLCQNWSPERSSYCCLIICLTNRTKLLIEGHWIIGITGQYICIAHPPWISTDCSTNNQQCKPGIGCE